MCIYLSTWKHAHIYSWKLRPGLVLLAKVYPYLKLKTWTKQTLGFLQSSIALCQTVWRMNNLVWNVVQYDIIWLELYPWFIMMTLLSVACS